MCFGKVLSIEGSKYAIISPLEESTKSKFKIQMTREIQSIKMGVFVVRIGMVGLS
jgi:hypothetical protein